MLVGGWKIPQHDSDSDSDSDSHWLGDTGDFDATQMINQTVSYNIRTNGWKRVSNFPTKASHLTSCSYAGLAFVVGGYVPQSNGSAFTQLSPKVYGYDGQSDDWFAKADMNEARAAAALHAIQDKLFVLGGAGDQNHVQISSIEMYDILQNQWTVVGKELGFPYGFAASLVDEQKIILIGGFSEATKSHSSKITVFDTSTRSMTEFKVEIKSSDCGCCVYLKC